MRRFLLWGAGLAVLLAVASVGWVRLAPSDPEGWHVDPVSAPDAGQANAWRIGPGSDAGVDAPSRLYAVPAAALAAALDEVALAEPGTERLAGGPEDLWTTYLQRSPRMRFPDYISVRALEREGGGSSLAVLSRSRFGRSDHGVNRARVERWVDRLRHLEE